MPVLNVFRKQGGSVRHFWGSEMLYAKTDALISPLWNVLDVTPEGRGSDWNPG